MGALPAAGENVLEGMEVLTPPLFCISTTDCPVTGASNTTRRSPILPMLAPKQISREANKSLLIRPGATPETLMRKVVEFCA